MTGKPTKVRTHARFVRWKVEYTTPYGKRRQEFYPTKRAADARQGAINEQAKIELHPVDSPDQTLGEYARRWLARNATSWKPRTLVSHRHLLLQHICPFRFRDRRRGERQLSDLPLGDLQRPLVKELIIAKRKEGYARDTLRLMYAVLRALLNEAAEDELIMLNPIATPGKSLRKHLEAVTGNVPPKIRAMDEGQLARFLAAAERTSALYPLYLVDVQTGMRLGEVLGLQLDDLRLDEREAVIQRSLGQESRPRQPTPGLTKTGRERNVDLSEQLVAVLREIVGSRTARALKHGWRPVPPWVFVTSTGTPYMQRNVLRDFDRVLVQAGLMRAGDPPPFSPHGLRHTFATLHLLAGAKPQWVQQQLGHSSIKVTIDTYGSWTVHEIPLLPIASPRWLQPGVQPETADGG